MIIKGATSTEFRVFSYLVVFIYPQLTRIERVLLWSIHGLEPSHGETHSLRAREGKWSRVSDVIRCEKVKNSDGPPAYKQLTATKASKVWCSYSHNCTLASRAVFHSVCQVWLSSGPLEFVTFSYCAWLWLWSQLRPQQLQKQKQKQQLNVLKNVSIINPNLQTNSWFQ